MTALRAATSDEDGRTRVHLAKDALGALTLNSASVLLGFLISIVLSRLLGRRGFGGYVYALAWSGVLTIPALLGSVDLLVRNITSYRTRRAWGLVRGIVRRCNAVVLLASAVVVVLAAGGGAVLIDDQPVRDTYLLALLLVPVVALMNVRQAEMIAFQRVSLARVAETVAYPLSFLGLIAAMSLIFGTAMSSSLAVGLNVVAATGALVLASSLARSTVPDLVRSAPPEFERAAWSRSTVALLVTTAIPALNTHSGTILLGLMADVDAAAVFNAAVRWATFTGFLQFAAALPLGPSIARLHASAEMRRLERLLSSAAMAVLVLSAPIALALVLFGRHALAVYGEAFAVGSTALRILVVGEVINLACGLVGVTLIMTGHERTVAQAGVVAVLANMVLSVVLIPPLGIEGAAIARASTTAGLNLALLLAVRRHLRISTAAIPRFRHGLDERDASGKP